MIVRAYGLFAKALDRLHSALKLKDINRRNSEIDAARGMLFEALADCTNPHLLEETCSAGHLRRLECAWAIEQTIAATYQVQNELGAASERLAQLQHTIRQNSLTVIERCETEDELDFLFPEITRIHNHDLAALDLWQNQVEWVHALPSDERKMLAGSELEVDSRAGSPEDIAVLAKPEEYLLYETLKQKSHVYSLHDQLRLII